MKHRLFLYAGRLSVLAVLTLWMSAPALSAEDKTEARSSAEVVALLSGTWDFEVRAPEAQGGAIQSSGRREAEAVSELVVAWSETYTDSARAGHGFTGFDGQRAEFYSMSVHSDRKSPNYMTGRMDDSGMVLFEPLFLTSEERPFQVVMEIVSDDEIAYYPRRRGLDGEWEIGWRAVFRRATNEAAAETE